MTISRWILLTMRNIVQTHCRWHLNTNFVFFQKSCHLRDNVEKFRGATETANDNMAELSMINSYHTRASIRPRLCTHTHAPTHTHTHTHKYVIIIGFPLQQRFRWRASLLRYTYAACLGSTYNCYNNNNHHHHNHQGRPLSNYRMVWKPGDHHPVHEPQPLVTVPSHVWPICFPHSTSSSSTCHSGIST
jgi:hypothetical protein